MSSAADVLTPAALGELFGDLAPAAHVLLGFCRDRGLPDETRERSRRALLCLHPEVQLGALPRPLPPVEPTAPPLERVAGDLAAALVGAVLEADPTRRRRLGAMLADVAREAAGYRQQAAA